VFALVAHNYAAVEEESFPEFTNFFLWVRDEDKFDSSDQVQILAQYEQHRSMILLSNQNMAMVKKGMVGAINLISLTIANQVTLPMNELVGTQPKTCAARKGQHVRKFQNRVQS